jgi:hypothetical protein
VSESLQRLSVAATRLWIAAPSSDLGRTGSRLAQPRCTQLDRADQIVALLRVDGYEMARRDGERDRPKHSSSPRVLGTNGQKIAIQKAHRSAREAEEPKTRSTMSGLRASG